jgi:hypothetical protein
MYFLLNETFAKRTFAEGTFAIQTSAQTARDGKYDLLMAK